MREPMAHDLIFAVGDGGVVADGLGVVEGADGEQGVAVAAEEADAGFVHVGVVVGLVEMKEVSVGSIAAVLGDDGGFGKAALAVGGEKKVWREAGVKGESEFRLLDPVAVFGHDLGDLVDVGNKLPVPRFDFSGVGEEEQHDDGGGDEEAHGKAEAAKLETGLDVGRPKAEGEGEGHEAAALGIKPDVAEVEDAAGNDPLDEFVEHPDHGADRGGGEVDGAVAEAVGKSPEDEEGKHAVLDKVDGFFGIGPEGVGKPTVNKSDAEEGDEAGTVAVEPGVDQRGERGGKAEDDGKEDDEEKAVAKASLGDPGLNGSCEGDGGEDGEGPEPNP